MCAMTGNGTSQYLGLGTATVISRNIPLTIMALVDSTSLRTSGNWNGVIGQGDYSTSGGMSFQIELSAAASPQLTFSASQATSGSAWGSTQDSTGGPTITPNTGWWLIAACVRESSNNLHVQYYAYRFNTGTLTTAAGGVIGWFNANTQLAPPAASAITAIAAEGEISVTDWWPGAFAWCGVWNADLSEGQSANPTPIWAAISDGPLAIADSTLAGLWILDNGDAHDYSANAHNGTYQGSPTFIGTPVNYLPVITAYRTTATGGGGGSNPLAGTGAIVSSGTADLSQTIALAGTAGIVSSGTAALVQIQALAGTGAITSSGTAVLLVAKPLAGTGAVTSTGAGNLTQTHALAGSGAIVSSGSAALSQTQALAGTGAIISGGTGNLSVSGSNALAGSGAITSGGTAALLVTKPLAGTGAIVSSGTGALAQTQALAGSSAITSSGTAALTQTQALAGAGAITSGGTAALTNSGGGAGTANFAIGVKTAGNGANDMSPAVVRDSSNRLWRAAATTGTSAFDNSGGQYNGNTLRMFRADQDQVPSSFTEQDSAHRPTNVGSFSIAIDGSDLIHVAIVHAYAAGTTGIYYTTFNTSTNLWSGTETKIGTVNYASTATYTLGDAGVALALDASGVPHVVSYGQTSGTGATHIFYTNHVSGSWSAAVQLDTATLGTNQRCMHPTCMFDSTGALHVAWMTITANYGTTLEKAYYINRSSGGTWGSVTTFAENLLGSIDNGPSLYVSEDDHIHIAYGLGDGTNPVGQTVTGTTVNNAVFYRYSSDGGATWNTTTQPPHYVAHDFVIGPDGFGGIHLWSHSQPTTVDGLGNAIGYAVLPTGSSTWTAWAQKAQDTNGNGFDCTVSPRKARFFHNRPAYLDIAYFDLNLPASAMLGSDPAGNALIGQTETGAIVSGGTAALTNSAQNALAGTGTIVSGGTGALGQTQPLAGSGGVVSSGTASLGQTQALSGTGAVVSSGTASLLIVKPLAGIGASTSAGTGALSQINALAGIGAIVSSGSATLTQSGVSNLAGTGAITSGGTAHLTQTQALFGSGAILSGGTASLSNVAGGSNALSGIGAIVSGGSASLTISVHLAGTGAILSGGSASLTVIVNLAGAGAITSSGNAALAQVQALSGSGAISSAGLALLRQTHVLAGSGSIVSGGHAALAQSGLTALGHLIVSDRPVGTLTLTDAATGLLTVDDRVVGGLVVGDTNL